MLCRRAKVNPRSHLIPNILALSGNAIQAFGNGTDVGVWQPQPPIEPTAAEPSITRRIKDQSSNALDALTHLSKLDLNGDPLYPVCGTLQVRNVVWSLIGQCCRDALTARLTFNISY